jgi:predicted RNA-binding Zn ribbon-like protein
MPATKSTTPAEIELVRSFLNTIDYEDDVEQLGSTAALHRWMLADHRIAARDRVTAADLDLALRLRAALRADLEAHHTGRPGGSTSRDLDAVGSELPLRLAGSDAGIAPCGTGIRGALEAIAAAAATARIRGSWSRLKICPADDCRWAFYDTSRNRSRRWCSMEVCGNRNKVRAFRERH